MEHIINTLFSMVLQIFGKIEKDDEEIKINLCKKNGNKKKVKKETDIIKRFEITEKWHKGWGRKLSNINEIVIHGTGGGDSADGLMDWMYTIGRKRYKEGIGLFHFIIDFNGDIYQVGRLSRWYYHSHSDRHDRFTIGIELMNKSMSNNEDYTDKQYTALHGLIFDYLLMRCENINMIVGHDYNFNKFSGNKKNCPGVFDWKRLENEMVARKKNYIKIFTEAYQLIEGIEYEKKKNK